MEIEGIYKAKEISRFSDNAREKLREAFKKRQIVDYEPNRLTPVELENISLQIDQMIGSGDDRSSTLVELRNFLSQNGTIFPELSHGTTSDVLSTILQHGLLPRDFASSFHDPEIHQIGEGGKLNFERRRQAVTEIYMGVGQGGLGTTLAYAEFVDNPSWNFNHFNPADLIRLQAKFRKILADVGGRDGEAKQILEDRLQSLAIATNRHAKEMEPDFPVLVGVMLRGKNAVNPTDPTLRFLTQWRGGVKYLQTETGFDSEVAVTVDSQGEKHLPVMAVFEKDKSKLAKLFEQQDTPLPQIISIEALKLLFELGFFRIKDGYEHGINYLNYSIYKHNKIIERAVDEFERGVSPFDTEDYLE